MKYYNDCTMFNILPIILVFVIFIENRAFSPNVSKLIKDEFSPNENKLIKDEISERFRNIQAFILPTHRRLQTKRWIDVDQDNNGVKESNAKTQEEELKIKRSEKPTEDIIKISHQGRENSNDDEVESAEQAIADTLLDLRKRWVDVDEDDADTKSGNREKTPADPSTDYTTLQGIVGALDKGLSNKFKTVNDITNLEPANSDNNQPSIEAGPMISGGINIDSSQLSSLLNTPTMTSVSATPVVKPVTIASNEQFVSEPLQSGTSQVVDNELGHSVENNHGTSIGIPISAFHGTSNQVTLSDGPALQIQGNKLQPLTISTPVSQPSVSRESITSGGGSVLSPSTFVTKCCVEPIQENIHNPIQVIHTQSQDNTPQILLTQGNLITEDPVHRSESGVLHKIEPGGPINKVIPGKSLFLKPISIIQRTPNRIFRHLHFYHRPRIIVIRRRHHNKCKSFSHQCT